MSDTLFIIETMKMETEIKAQVAGRVAKVQIKKVDRVTTGKL